MGSTTANRLRELRTNAGLTQEQLAVRAGVTAKTVASVERGAVVPLRGTLALLATALEVSVADITGPEEIAA